MNNMFKELLNVEKKYVTSSIVDRQKNNLKIENSEELQDVLGEV